MFGVILARIQTPNRYCIAVVSLFDPLINYPPPKKNRTISYWMLQPGSHHCNYHKNTVCENY